MKTKKVKQLAFRIIPILTIKWTLLIIIFLSSCGSDDEPSRTDLLVGIWELDEFNGSNIRSGITVEITFERNGDYEQDINDNGEIERYTGEWEWNKDQDKITIDYDQNFTDLRMNINELTADELEFDDGLNTYLYIKK